MRSRSGSIVVQSEATSRACVCAGFLVAPARAEADTLACRSGTCTVAAPWAVLRGPPCVARKTYADRQRGIQKPSLSYCSCTSGDSSKTWSGSSTSSMARPSPRNFGSAQGFRSGRSPCCRRRRCCCAREGLGPLGWSPPRRLQRRNHGQPGAHPAGARVLWVPGQMRCQAVSYVRAFCSSRWRRCWAAAGHSRCPAVVRCTSRVGCDLLQGTAQWPTRTPAACAWARWRRARKLSSAPTVRLWRRG